jgi:branched-chain amino acid transport system permease protein
VTRPVGLGAALRWSWPVLVLVVPLGAIAILVDAFGSLVLERTVITMLIDVVLVVGIYIFIGNSGILSFGHISFMAVGAYTTALVAIPTETKEFILPALPQFIQDIELGPLPAGLTAAAMAAIFGLVISVPIMRLSGIAAALSMFAVLLIIHTVANNWEQVTRGRLTMFGLPTDAGTIPAALLVAVVAIIVAYVFQESNVGLRLRASREDEVAARAVGVSVARERRIAFVLSAFFVGAGGFLFAEFIGSFNPDSFFVAITFLTIAMLVVGGMTSLTGAVIGVVVVTTVGEFLRKVEGGTAIGPLAIPSRPGLREVGLAIMMLVILIFRPSGITGGREVPWPGDAAAAIRRRLQGVRALRARQVTRNVGSSAHGSTRDETGAE